MTRVISTSTGIKKMGLRLHARKVLSKFISNFHLWEITLNDETTAASFCFTPQVIHKLHCKTQTVSHHMVHTVLIIEVCKVIHLRIKWYNMFKIIESRNTTGLTFLCRSVWSHSEESWMKWMHRNLLKPKCRKTKNANHEIVLFKWSQDTN